MRLLRGGRMRAVVAVAAVVGVFAVVGAATRSSPSATEATAVTADPGSGTVPSASWYWTMAVSPSSPNTLVVGTSDGLYRSGDGGRTWKRTGPAGFDATSVVVAGHTMFAGGARLSVDSSPVTKTSLGRVAANGPTVLEASTDGGLTWQALRPQGLPDTSVQALAVNPANTSDLYALLDNGAVYRSSDGGGSFELVSRQLGVTPWALAILQNNQVVAGDMDSGSHLDPTFLAGDMDSGSHVSPNGTSWQATSFTNSEGSKMVMEYAVQPGDSLRILMTAYGVEMSTDGGEELAGRPQVDRDVRTGRMGLSNGRPRVRDRIRRISLADDHWRRHLERGAPGLGAPAGATR